MLLEKEKEHLILKIIRNLSDKKGTSSTIRSSEKRRDIALKKGCFTL